MRVVKYSLDDLCAMEKLDLGIKDEKMSRRIEISIPRWRTEYSSPAVSVIAQDPTGEVYKVDATWENGTLAWVVSGRDTQYAGGGYVQLVMTAADGAVEKSPKIATYVAPALEYAAN